MKVVLFGATGMVGQGALRECLLDPEVTHVLAVGRSASGQSHAKLEDLVVPDLHDYSAVEPTLAGYDACLFCLGITSSGLDEAQYTRITYDLTMAAANTLVKLDPGMTFVFISGAGSDSTEKGGTMWARVKGRAENALARLPFRRVYSFRPGFIVPLHGIESRTAMYRALYKVIRPLAPLAQRLAPRHVLTTESLGRAMLVAAKHGAPKPVLEAPDINALVAA